MAAAMLAGAPPVSAQNRTPVLMSDLVGQSLDSIEKRLSVWPDRAVASRDLQGDLSGQRLDVIYFGLGIAPDCPSRVRVAFDGDRVPEAFVFLDGKLAFITLVSPPPANRPLPTMAQLAERPKLARKAPPGPLDHEAGLQAYYDQLHSEAADPAARLTAACRQLPKPQPANGARVTRDDTTDPVIVAGMVAVDAVGLAIMSPFLVAKPATDHHMQTQLDRNQALLESLQFGQAVPGGPEAFAKTNRNAVRWHPSTAVANYGLLTIDLTTPVDNWLQTSGVQHYAVLGVRDGKVEWRGFDRSNLCLSPDPAQPSMARPGCSEYGYYKSRP